MSRRSRRSTIKAPGSDRSIALRSRFLLACWLFAGTGLFARALYLQVGQRTKWQQEATEQHRMPALVAAGRGEIVDRGGVALALSHETFRVGVAPHELDDRTIAASTLQEILGLSGAEAHRITSADRRWVTVPGRFPPTIRASLGGLRGVYVERELRRFYPQGPLGRRLLGAVVDEFGAGGIEQEFESHLRGVPGAEIVARDSDGRPIPGETWTISPPRFGGSVVLALDASLQEIANEALKDAVESTGSRGGDLLVTDPSTGEVLAMVSLRDGTPSHMGAINTPYEPGSTLKPFTVAALLREQKASLEDAVDTGNGSWTSFGRTIDDVSAVGTVSLGHALQVSSNVGIAKAAQRLSHDEQYEALRDFGFGLPTAIRLPGEASGTLRRPEQWSRQSPASLAIGYEIAVTPIQMAMAYGAFANGGVLMQPLLVKELRDAQGDLIQAFEPRELRRVISQGVARQITDALVSVVEAGTGTRARLASFSVAGKSGTSRAYARNGGYERGAYFSSFVGFFPADSPQLVVFVKLERPRGVYYGGATAAPVTRATMEAILAARESPLDQSALAALARAQRMDETASEPLRASPPSPVFASTLEPPELAAPILSHFERRAGSEFDVPDVRGLSGRSAARRLHALGLNVIWESAGPISGTAPQAGSTMTLGDTIRLLSTFNGLGPDPSTRSPTRRSDD